jgi:subfamily B ATP-binding cassette protein MsbA
MSVINKSSLSIFKRLGREHIKPYIPRLLLALLFMALAAGSTAALAKFLQPVIDNVFMQRQVEYLLPVGAGVLLIFFVKGISSYGESVTMNFVGQRIISDMQERLFQHFSWADFESVQKIPTGELISRFTNDVWLLRNAVSTTLTGIGKDALTLIFLVSLMFYQDTTLACLAFFAFPVAFLPIIRIGRRMRKITTNAQHENAQWTTMLEQVFQGARLIRAYGMEKYEISRAAKMIETLFQLNQKSCRTRSASHPIMESLGGVAVVCVIMYGGNEVIQGHQTTGAFISFIGALLLAYEPMKRLAHLNSNLQEGIAAAIRIFNDLDQPPTIVDALDAVSLPRVKGRIDFEHVTFRYESSETNILEDISFSLEAGKRVALVGPSGGGKSTIMNLIPRLYDVTQGRILVDGVPLRQAALATLRKNIALVSQEIMLFDDTVAANIAYGNLEATQEDIITAAKGAAAHDFILDLPQGYNTLVGEAGFRLSGGQRQRLSIARAMLKDAPILLLDEATSALDTESEQIVQEALVKLMVGRTSLVIAHRLTTIMDADEILVIEGGKIVERGSHTDLVAQGGLYTRLASRQENR